MKKYIAFVFTIFLSSYSFPSLSQKILTSHQVLVECNKSASNLVELYDIELKSLKESRRLDLLILVSDACKGGYRSASEGMQYKDIERYLTSNTTGSELPIGLMLAAVKKGYAMYSNFESYN
ncbi:hypothetical protein ACGVWS_12005 [Enterobacteriaceae bacterium LUAb1]